MTARTTPPAGPATHARAHVSVAWPIITRALANHPEIKAPARLRLTCLVGSPGWHLASDDEQIAEGNDGALSACAQRVTMAAVAQLSIEAKGQLLSAMQEPEPPMPGDAPSFFAVALTVEGETWGLQVAAHARRTAVTVAELSGTLEPASHQAAA